MIELIITLSITAIVLYFAATYPRLNASVWNRMVQSGHASQTGRFWTDVGTELSLFGQTFVLGPKLRLVVFPVWAVMLVMMVGAMVQFARFTLAAA